MTTDDARHAHLARSFGALAEDYHRHRPGYPAAALDWALAPLAESSGSGTSVDTESSGSGTSSGTESSGSGTSIDTERTLLDLAAGTGKLSADLRERASKVIAVEPDPEMLAVLRATLPEVTALEGHAERIPLPTASVDSVLVGSAFHWFDPEPATAEMVRVLRPGGVLALLWNREDADVEWVRGYYRTVGRPEITEPLGPRITHPGLGPVEHARFRNPRPMTTDALLRNLATFSWVSTRPEADRARTLAAARDYLSGRPETSAGRFVLPLGTDVLRAVRR